MVSLLALLAALLPDLTRDVSMLALLARLTEQPGLDCLLAPILERELTLTLADGPVRAKRYAPVRAGRSPGVLLLHGVHPRGIDEPRLVAFARALASGGLDVLTPELPELLHDRLDPLTIDHIQQLSLVHAAQTHDDAVGVIGISFAGGLSLMAAARQHAARPIGFVATIGAHDDLIRLCRYYAGEEVRGPNGERVDVAPHPYGARVMIREHLDRFFAPGDLAAAERALDAYLHDDGNAARHFAQAISAKGRPTIDALLDSHDRTRLAPLLERAAAAARLQLMAASPHGHLAGLRVPVFLLHGAGDPIIPSIETRYLAREVPSPWLRAVVITDQLRHAEFPKPPKLADTWELVRFLKAVFAAAGSSIRIVPAGAP
ncbi:MAG TPA: hypothetical protein VGI70_03190 [Polyangiales bacterium]